MINRYNISYCSNIFKNNNLSEFFYNLNKYNTNLKNKNISVCISNKIIKVLNEKKNIKNIITWNKINSKNINLINAFVYKNFHQKKIKENIYYPDWTKKERLNFTKEIIFFAQKINNNACGISTLPITYKLWIKNNAKYNIKTCIMHFFDLLKVLIKIKKYKNILIHIDIEPEPCCLLEQSKDFIHFFKIWLSPELNKKLKNNFNFSKKKAHAIITRHFNLCFDMCHSAVMFEKEKKSLDLIRKLKLKIGRVQVSSAIKIMDVNKTNLIYLKFLKKSPFLHQSLIKKKNLKIDKKNDFKNINIDHYTLIKEMRIHCHIPIYIKKISNGIYTTQDELIKSLSNIIKHNDTKNLEIETYTYNVIYNKKYNKIKSMIKEFNWLINLIKKIYDKTF